MEELEKNIAIDEQGINEYEKTHSNCCDAQMINGFCLSCKEHTVSQKEVGE